MPAATLQTECGWSLSGRRIANSCSLRAANRRKNTEFRRRGGTGMLRGAYHQADHFGQYPAPSARLPVGSQCAALAAVEIGDLLHLARHRRNKTTGRGIGERVPIERIVVLVDVVAKIDSAVVRHP